MAEDMTQADMDSIVANLEVSYENIASALRLSNSKVLELQGQLLAKNDECIRYLNRIDELHTNWHNAKDELRDANAIRRACATLVEDFIELLKLPPSQWKSHAEHMVKDFMENEAVKTKLEKEDSHG
jgi:hypothetical protein